MVINVYSLSIMFSVFFLLLVIELVRKNKLQERYCLLWILMSIILLVLSSTLVIIETVSAWLDIKNPPSLLFLFGLGYLILYNLATTVTVSKQSERITRLTQEIALLRQKITDMNSK